MVGDIRVGVDRDLESAANEILDRAGHRTSGAPPPSDVMRNAIKRGISPVAVYGTDSVLDIPDPVDEVDDLSILRSGAVLTFQRRGESDEQHAARHRARYREWRGIPQARPSVSPLSPS